MNLKKLIQKKLFSSLKVTINTFYTAIVLIFVLISGTFSFFLASQQVQENTEKNVKEALTFKSEFLDTTLNEVMRQLILLSDNPHINTLLLSKEDSIKSYIQVDNDVNRIYYRYQDVMDSIYMNLNNGKFVFWESEQQQLNPSFSYLDYFKKYSESNESIYWRNLHKDEVFSKDQNVLTVFKLVGNESSPANGIILFNLKENFFLNILDNYNVTDNSYMMIVSKDGVLFSDGVEDQYSFQLNELREIINGKEKGQHFLENQNGKKLLVDYSTIGISDWKLVSVIPMDELTQKINYIKHITFFLILLIITIATALVNIVGKYISKPIKNMSDQIEKINENYTKLDYTSSIPREMEILYRSFNDLMDRNQNLVDQIELEQEEKQKLAVAALQAQINPHFLYNTLSSIKGLCDMQMNTEASKMISALSSYFRIGLSRGKNIISIEEEILHIKSYLYIMEMRYGDHFSYHIDIDKKITQNNITKLTLQPIVENAIYHGIKNIRTPGIINIKGYQKDDHIHFDVIDNGIGIVKEKLTKIHNELSSPFNGEERELVGIGLRSVDLRIKSYFGKEFGLSIDSEYGKGTIVSIVIPKSK
ncbi:sensor histidine kinase [Caldifermentibacillus hisashii]|uniref:sensor histidine kinase n=1 Tax=Caldifermentibacillus hisashii TaxID=996558 RepID=UPI0031FD93C7